MQRSTLLFIAIAIACVLFLLGRPLGKHRQGATESRGYAPGAVTRLALLHTVVANPSIAVAH